MAIKRAAGKSGAERPMKGGEKLNSLDSLLGTWQTLG
jgi:hypothetical protein